MEHPIVFVVGPTGSGKSKLAVDLALRLHTRGLSAEIISVDVMQMYSGLPVATNKMVTEGDRQGIPHHFLGFLDPFATASKYTVHDFVAACVPLVAEMRKRGAVPIVCGGTNYYVQGLLCDTLVNDVVVEEGVEGEEEEEDWLKILTEVDPVMAQRWHPCDTRRIKRSVEVFRTTGRRHSDIIAEQGANAPIRYPCHVMFWVHSEPATLRDRISRRVSEMESKGLEDEVVGYHNRPGSADTPLATAIGFKEFAPFFANPSREMWALCLADLVNRTAAYARQQSQWIRNRFATHPDITMYCLEGPDTATADGILTGVVKGKRFSMPSRISEQKNCMTQRCDTCDKVLCGPEQYGIHMASKHHKKMMVREKRLREEEDAR